MITKNHKNYKSSSVIIFLESDENFLLSQAAVLLQKPKKEVATEAHKIGLKILCENLERGEKK